MFIVDNNGDIYFEGQDHILNNANSEESFKVGSAFFNSVTSNFNSFSQDLGSLPISTNSLIIKSNLGIDVSSFDENGNIYTLGQGVYENSQANCLVDGNYCNGDIRENRDYFCDITGSKTGFCDYSVLSSEDCSTRLSTDTESGIDKFIPGTVTDFITCSGSSCTFVLHSDSCTSGTDLVDYYNSGSSVSSTNFDCSDDDHYYCSGLNRYEEINLCGSGACDGGTNYFVETCVTPTTILGSWNSCIDWDTKARTNIEFSATCSASGCGQTSSNVAETQDCNSGNYCSGGSCLPIVNCVGSWSDTSTCSVSCGGGVKEQVYSITTPASLGGSSCPYVDGATRLGTTSCNTQSCCVSHDYRACSGGLSVMNDIYWYDSCGVKEEMIKDCSPTFCLYDHGIPICKEEGSTPYLFSGVNNDYYIENDVLSTYFDQYYENSKSWYEEDSGDKQVYTLTDYYEMRLNPTIEDEGVKLLLKEIEPEESHIDEVKLLRTIYNENAELIIDHEENSIKIVDEELLENKILSCNLNEETCFEEIIETDSKFISVDAGNEIEIELDISELKDKEVYLIINSWGHVPMKNQLEPLEAYSEASIRTMFDLGNGEYEILKDIHPRTIESNHYLYIGDIIDEAQNDKLSMKLLFTQSHNLDSVQMMIVDEKPFVQEELSLIKAEHSKDGNVLFNLLNKDNMYAHTVRGDEIEMLFSKPKLDLKEGEKETFVFVSSGFYHGLRTYLYPDVNPENDYLPEIEKYVEELNKLN
ncbi:MAG: thrombospondin type-1 domain-containing protein [Candidatus Woesearchaeota archaeon]|nr:thrombospondin type-1 domain-containing protein [Candidatus Woesearchaeota archaeon]